SERAEIYLTLYTITDEKTTEDGILRVQKALDEIIYNRYKTHLVLKCFTLDEYEKQLEKLYAEFEKLEEAKREEAAKEKEEEKKRQEAEKNLSKAEKRKLEEERKKAQEEEERLAAEEEAARLERIKNGEEDPISGPQLDIFYLPTADAYYNAIANEQLLPLDNFLKVDFKEFYDYLSSNLLTNATLAYDEEDAQLYGIPNNRAVTSDGWYYVFNTKLAKKYKVDLTQAAPQFSDFMDAIHKVAEKEEGVIPIANPAPVNNVDFYNDIEGFPIAVNNSEYGVFEARGVMQTYGENSIARTHFAYMAELREAGYFVDREMTTKDQFFLDMRQGSVEDVAKWQEEGYTVLTYRRPATQIEACRNGFFGISAYCDEEYQSRAMEVLQMLYSNEAVHNLFAFGQQDIDYTLNEDGVTVTSINDEYVMDFETTGNLLIGYLPEGYDVDYIENARAANRAARLSGFSSFFLLLDEDDQEWFDEILALEKDCLKAYEEMCKGTPDWEKMCNDLNEELDSVDFTGFINEILAPSFRSAAKQVRSADGVNYQNDPIYLESEYQALLQGGLINEDGDAVGETEETAK
ncbi:MAG: hypothetical protein II328_04630, partial [Clostridia bacterium]|nr:hypothetical protein [Clostridia bacterium]